MPYLRAKAQDYFEELGGGVNVLDEGLDARQIQALTDQVSNTSNLSHQSRLTQGRASKDDLDELSRLYTRTQTLDSRCGCCYRISHTFSTKRQHIDHG